MFDLYKPLRNYLREFPLNESLGVIRSYLQNLQFGTPLSKDIQVDPSFFSEENRHRRMVAEWQLEILAKEVILNSEEKKTNKSLKEWRYFSTAVNKLKDLENNIAILYKDVMQKNILLELYRLGHRQFPWQQKPNIIWLSRYYKIFRKPEIDTIIQRHIGISVKELYTLGFAFTGCYLTYFAVNYPPELEIVGIDKVKLDKFLDHFSDSMPNMKQSILSSQSYTHDYVYTLNPLKIKPLIRVINEGRDSHICPVPTYLFWRFTEGIYYEICSDPELAHPFGEAFQSYIGEVSTAANINGNYDVVGEEEYYIGKNKKHTSDWVLVGDANLFIECKTKKLRLQAKVSLVGNVILEEDLNLMASFVVQSYKTITSYLNNEYPTLKNNGNPTFPVVVTLEDWLIFGDPIIKALDEKIKGKLIAEGLSGSLLEEMPYSICPAEDFERLVQIFDKIGIKTFMQNKTSGEKRLWTIKSLMFSDYNEELKQCKELFPDDFKEISPDILQ